MTATGGRAEICVSPGQVRAGAAADEPGRGPFSENEPVPVDFSSAAAFACIAANAEKQKVSGQPTFCRVCEKVRCGGLFCFCLDFSRLKLEPKRREFQNRGT